MTPPIYQYMIGYGKGLPIGSLTNVENILDPAGRALYPPQSYGTYDQGLQVTALDGLSGYEGYDTVEWGWIGNNSNGYMTYGGARNLRTGYLDGSFSAPVTVYTKTTNESAYELYDATATIKKFPDSAPNFKVFNRFSIKLTGLTAR